MGQRGLEGGEESACKQEYVNSIQFMRSFRQCREKLTGSRHSLKYTVHPNTKYARSLSTVVHHNVLSTQHVCGCPTKVCTCAYECHPLKCNLFSCASARVCVCVHGLFKGMDGKLSKSRVGTFSNLTLDPLGTLPPQWG